MSDIVKLKYEEEDLKMLAGFLPMYHVERTVQEAGTLFGDGSHIIYVNGSYKNDAEKQNLMM